MVPGPTRPTRSTDSGDTLLTVERAPDLRRIVAAARSEGRTIGFVPTMGALHAGHASLFDRARRDGHFVVVSIYVNPTQFNDPQDFANYPKTQALDDETCSRTGVDLIFRPTNDTVYPEGFDTKVSTGSLAERFEGSHRPGHFDGVATVVLKLFNLVSPDAAYFGRKDFQQLAVVRRMVRDFNLEMSVVGCPTIREADGLAMSSRNVKLGPDSRARAGVLSTALQTAIDALRNGDDVATARASGARVLDSASGVAVDYFEIVDRDSLGPVTTDRVTSSVALVAATIDGVRLIDNMQFDETGHETEAS